jgi:hypothetical protein
MFLHTSQTRSYHALELCRGGELVTCNWLARNNDGTICAHGSCKSDMPGRSHRVAGCNACDTPPSQLQVLHGVLHVGARGVAQAPDVHRTSSLASLASLFVAPGWDQLHCARTLRLGATQRTSLSSRAASSPLSLQVLLLLLSGLPGLQLSCPPEQLGGPPPASAGRAAT